MRALSIRQPFAELILRGIKTIEYRTRSTKILGERFYIYASKTSAGVPGGMLQGRGKLDSSSADSSSSDSSAATRRVRETPLGRLDASARVWSHDLRVDGSYLTPLPGVWVPQSDDRLPWLMELATALKLFPGELPTGVIVGSAVIDRVTPGEGVTEGYFHWHIADVKRLRQPIKPTGHPQPMWWRND